jgi:3-oxoacyl-[acyl-carrier protein] reductase
MSGCDGFSHGEWPVLNRVAVVSGGASGIGRATVELLTRQGVTVASLDRDGDPSVDVSDERAVFEAVDRARGEDGPIDIVVNAAGIAAIGRPLDDGYRETWDRALSVNLTGTMHVVRACLGDLVASGRGRIVNVASTDGLGATRNTGPYTVSKHGVIGFTRSLAVDYGRHGVTANCVCPGATLTGMTEVIPEADRIGFARQRVPVGRYGRPDEIAFMIVALTAMEASFVNGAVIVVDGGMTAVG